MVIKKKPKKKSKNYFTIDTENAILDYNAEQDPKVRNSIYEKHIHYPFFKLTQNIIHTFKFYNTEVKDLEHLQHEIIVFLLGKMHLYHHSNSIEKKLNNIINKEFLEDYTLGSFLKYTNHSPKINQQQIHDFIEGLNVSPQCKDKLEKLRVPKAYSYFGTIVKRWLIVYNNTNYNKKINKTPLDNLVKENSSYVEGEYENVNKEILSNIIDDYVDYCYNNLESLFPKKEDQKIADALLLMFKERENLREYKKKYIYFCIKEIVDVPTSKITKVSNKLKEIYNSNFYKYINEGYNLFDN